MPRRHTNLLFLAVALISLIAILTPSASASVLPALSQRDPLDAPSNVIHQTGVPPAKLITPAEVITPKQPKNSKSNKHEDGDGEQLEQDNSNDSELPEPYISEGRHKHTDPNDPPELFCSPICGRKRICVPSPGKTIAVCCPPEKRMADNAGLCCSQEHFVDGYCLLEYPYVEAIA